MNPELRRLAADRGGVFSRRQAVDAGYTPEEIRARLADRRWERLRHGQYVERVDLSGLPVWEREIVRHRLLIHAAVNAMKPGSAVVSHHSALVLHGVPVWQADLAEVQLTRTTGRSGAKSGVRHHRGQLDDPDLTVLARVPATSVARAVAEHATRSSFEAAVISADHAMRRGDIPADELRRLLETIDEWAGAPRVRAVMAFANPLSESVGESRLRVVMHNEGLPAPELQREFYDSAGLIGRPDFFFPSYNTVVEFDGDLKYDSGSREVLLREKSREDRLRALGFEFVRTGWTDLDRPAWTAHQIRQAFARAQSSRRTG
ncbi:hypothetical protein E1263_42385 [Kribbella antibiotica]|uniref:AbiEi antitoxin N-terminal domain-containing protein n=1 Tax=Kribbella antibiotica TaxID=190195 RepID=A0A4R4YDH2_9ACTN|nr:type IV toxin-antitoxin system AbiEi family antitoxin domain-containing protein [Kribbella antibiotica]TDD41869.1 hypothetical protein E1263_42385 [Kribbella antibiotica]